MRTGDLRNNNDNHYSESIYENAAVLKSASMMMTPVTNTIEKYEFGQMSEEEDDVEERVPEVGDTFEAVSFQVVAITSRWWVVVLDVILDEINIFTVRTWRCLTSQVNL